MQSRDRLDSTSHNDVVPVLLLKNKSNPCDAYSQLLNAPPTPAPGRPWQRFDSHFIPVLSHRRNVAGAARLRNLLLRRQICKDGGDASCNVTCDENNRYGGLIFTSQRAVEIFAEVIAEGNDGNVQFGWPHLQDVPVYSVGPATKSALEAVLSQSPLSIAGQHCGNGDALATFILDDYRHSIRGHRHRPPLLFLTGEQRRDVITRTLADPALPPEKRIRVDEEVLYGSGVLESFPANFAAALRRTVAAPVRCVVVFSPTGCDMMLRCLDVPVNDPICVSPNRQDSKLYVITIGPTTQTHLIENFGFEPDICAAMPSPEGILQALTDLLNRS